MSGAWVAAGTIGGALITSNAMGDASDAQSGTDAAAIAEQRRQFDINQANMVPWMEAARGTMQYQRNYDPANLTPAQRANYDADLQAGLIDAEGYALVQRGGESGGRVELGYEGGALDQLTAYGRGDIRAGDYLPGTEIPEFRGGEIDIRTGQPAYDVQGQVSDFDANALDLYRDPGYQYREQRALDAVDSRMGAAGKVISGERAEGLMQTASDMASQEYGNMFGRALQDYDRTRGAESARFTQDLTGYEARKGISDTAYGRDVDKYGRYIDEYNAGRSREAGMYDRGMDRFKADYGVEGDYLNRLAGLSNVGMDATSQVGNWGMTSATNTGNLLTAQGQNQAALDMGQANLWSNAIGDLTSLYTMNSGGYNPSYNLNAPAGGNLYSTSGGYGGTGMGIWSY